MKTLRNFTLLILLGLSISCNNANSSSEDSQTSPEEQSVGQSGVKDETSSPNIVQVAAGSKDHSTLVAAVKAGGLLDALSNAGPFTVFAPTNAAFEKLPKGTVEGLLEPDKKLDLQNVLEYHTYVGVLKTDYMQDGQSYEQVNGKKIKITKKGDKVMVNDKATIVASVPASNGIIHIIDEVLLSN
jgi:uncharacterized surface protein with fasciclin (FAS1) repeats